MSLEIWFIAPIPSVSGNLKVPVIIPLNFDYPDFKMDEIIILGDVSRLP